MRDVRVYFFANSAKSRFWANRAFAIRQLAGHLRAAARDKHYFRTLDSHIAHFLPLTPQLAYADAATSRTRDWYVRGRGSCHTLAHPARRNASPCARPATTCALSPCARQIPGARTTNMQMRCILDGAFKLTALEFEVPVQWCQICVQYTFVPVVGTVCSL